MKSLRRRLLWTAATSLSVAVIAVIAWYRIARPFHLCSCFSGTEETPCVSDGIIARCCTWEEMKDLEAYAVARRVTIVPELETPGHSGAMARSRPDICSGLKFKAE